MSTSFNAIFPENTTACTRGGCLTFSLPLKSTLTGRRPTKMVLQKVQGTGCVVPVQYTYQMVLPPKCPPLFMPVFHYGLTACKRAVFWVFKPYKTKLDSRAKMLL